jgi:two-component system chemotaxis response regulator CheB
MPKAAFDIGAVEKQLPLERLAAAIMAETSTNKKH